MTRKGVEGAPIELNCYLTSQRERKRERGGLIPPIEATWSDRETDVVFLVSNSCPSSIRSHDLPLSRKYKRDKMSSFHESIDLARSNLVRLPILPLST